MPKKPQPVYAGFPRDKSPFMALVIIISLAAATGLALAISPASPKEVPCRGK